MKLFLIFLTLPSLIYAADVDFMEVARLRKYIGGADEGDLKVQTVLYQAPNKKKKPVKVESNEGY